MIGESSYSSVISVSESVENHFAKHLSEAKSRGEGNLAFVPAKEVIVKIIDVAFWASLRREEGYSPKISLAFLPPEQAGQPLVFHQKFTLTSEALTKLSPGVERAGVHMGVWYDDGELFIWGTTLSIPNFCFVLDVSEPGLLVIKHRRHHGFGKFRNVAVLMGDQVKLVSDSTFHIPDCPTLVSSLINLNSLNDGSVSALIQLAVSMRNHGHGGILLVVPAGDDWQDSILHPVKYRIAPPYRGLADLMCLEEEERPKQQWQTRFWQEIDYIAGLTAVDGATVINSQYELLAFGTKIRARQGSAPVETILATEPVVSNIPAIAHPSKSGGTRHYSAAQFVNDQRNAIALVASQDGKFTVFSWSVRENLVQANRIDSLLM